METVTTPTAMGRALAEIVFDPLVGRYVSACPLPENYLRDAARALKPRRTNVTLRRAREEGFETERELGRSNMSGVEPVPDLLPPPAVPAGRPVRVFHISQMVDKPADALGAQGVADLKEDMRRTMLAMVSVGDYDPALEIVALKEWDALAHAYERICFNLQESAERVKIEIRDLMRADDGGEINMRQVERLEERLQGYRVQWFHADLKHKVAREERERAVSRSGLDWPPYRSLAERSQYSAQEWRRRQRGRMTNSHYLANVSEHEYRRWLDDPTYRPRHRGIEDAAE